MGQHRRRTPRRRLLAPTLLTALSALTIATVVVGTHGLASEATAAGGPSAMVLSPAAPPPPPTPSPAATDPATPTAADPAVGPQTPSPAGSPSPREAQAATSAATPTPSATSGAIPTVTPGTTAEAPATPESATVGALFSGDVAAGDHFCTASVLHSPTGNLLLTAAHCLDSTDGVVFAPGYRNGTAPYGTWRVTAIHTTTGWSRSGDQDEDFAILETAAAGGRRIEDVVGANTLGTDEPFGTTVRLYGYPSGGDAPLLCTNTTGRQSTYQRVVDCPDYPGGTSGGPWISTATGHVIGAIGGYQQGGDSNDTSYSEYFDHTIAALYAAAVAAAS
ncbi:serine protease [Streptomyces sp. CB01881]|uniref:trypsin-like serine peptidase n=1 Tax=Streptomyces sp. CB01881 TaxID=2078691 RepID=UPI000CDC24D0|nr:serine protease [Streptomyces sp. CB01881]AUY49835.1 serine protease [Streptomyces sp. CB01881]TYC73226.1 trypsin-like serine protease [Streptomyces sp. CB01881]